MLFSKFGINYNNEPEMYKKGTILIRDMAGSSSSEDANLETASDSPELATQVSSGKNQINAKLRAQAKDKSYHELSRRQKQRQSKRRQKARILRLHVDIIRDEFWEKYPFLLDEEV